MGAVRLKSLKYLIAGFVSFGVAACQAHKAGVGGNCGSVDPAPGPADCIETGSVAVGPKASLEESSAVDGNPRVEAARQAALVAKEETAKARAANRPKLSAVASADWRHGGDGDPNGETDGRQSAGFEVTMPIRQAIFGKPRVRSAAARAKAAALEFKTTEQAVLVDMAQIRAQIERDRAALKALESHIARLRRLMGQANGRRASGDMSQTDLDQIRLRIVSAEVDRADTRASLDENIERLPTVEGSHGTVALRRVRHVIPVSQAATIKEALSFSPEIRASREAAAAAKADLTAAGRELLPEVNVNASAKRDWSDGDGGDNDLFLGIRFDLPMYDGGGRFADIRQKRAAAGERDLRVAELERSVTARVKADWAQRKAARRKLNLADKRIAAARAALAGVARARKVGARTIEDELSAVSDVLAARIGRSEARRQLVVAEHRLAAHVGALAAAYSVNR